MFGCMYIFIFSDAYLSKPFTSLHKCKCSALSLFLTNGFAKVCTFHWVLNLTGDSSYIFCISPVDIQLAVASKHLVILI